ncbi:(2Fe-2S)-binding protein [Lentisalinibacter salinarum]|uniref:(2Fe-2S)-binding protein n=1 Tax=Lentisalinibacter salinarum TaxID=2992239 RepID=UPI00386DF988
MKLTINERTHAWDGDPDQPLLWVLRDELGLTGSKFGCGIGVCGACTVHVDGRARNACRLPMRELDGARVTTIEGLSPDAAHAVQRAWADEDVPQCGYCQAGQIMAVVDLLRRVPAPDDVDIDRLHSNLCRCGTHVRIRRAIHRAARYLREEA